MKLKSKKILLPVLMFMFISQYLAAQNDTSEWKPGYIVFKKHTDTLTGYLFVKYSSFGFAKKILVRKKRADKKEIFKIGCDYSTQDTVRYFGVSGKRYMYIDYTDNVIPTNDFYMGNSFTGWAEIIETGNITSCLGFSIQETQGGGMMVATGGGGMTMTGGSSANKYIPTYCLKKGNTPMALIQAPSISAFRGDDFKKYKVDDRNKNHFIHFISDYPELAEKLKNKTLYFGDIEKIVSDYNTWAKTDVH